MADEIAGVGIRVDTDGVSKGIKALDALADQGPKVEKSLQGVETASTKTGKSLATLGQGGSESGLAKVGKAGKDAAAEVGKLGDASAKTAASVKQIDKAGNDTARAIAGVGAAVKSLVASNEAVAASIRGVATAETAYITKLNEEARQLRATIAERDKYIAQATGMLSASKEIAAAVGAQVSGLKQVQSATGQASESMLAMVRTGVGAFLGGAVVTGAKAAAAAIYEASAAGERLRTMLNFASGGNGAQEIEYLRQVTGRLGLEFASTSRAYGQFQAAARGTALEGQKARDVFESIAKASAVMGLSTADTSGVLLALQQMISKGTVSAEELRGQLGERLPGAFQIAAKAMGVTTAELGKMLEQGTVIADDFLPRFARAMNENIGGAAEQAADRLDAATNRFANAWERTKQIVGDAGVSQIIKTEIQALTNDVTVFGETMEKVGKSGGGFLSQIAAASTVEAGRLAFSILNGAANTFNATLNTLTNDFLGFLKLPTQGAYLPDFLKTSAQQAAVLAQDIANAEAEYARLKAQGADKSESFYTRNEIYNLGQLIAKLKEAQAEKEKLEAGPAYSAARDSQAASVAEATRLDAVRTAMQKVQQSLSGVKDSFYKDLAALKAGYDEGLIKLDAYQEQVAKLIEQSGGGKATTSAIKAQQSAYAELISSIKAKVAESEAELRSSHKLSESEKLRIKLNEELAAGNRKLSDTQKAAVNAQLDKLEKHEQEARAIKAYLPLYAQQVQASEEAAAAFVAESKAREAGRLAVDEYARSINEQIAATQFELGLVGKTQQAREVALAQYRIELELKKQIAAIDKNAGFDEAQRIEERTRAREAAARAMANAETRVYVDEWKRTSDEIERSLTDALMRGFESGKGFGENLRDTLVNMFKTLVLRPTLAPIISGLTGSIGGALGLSSLAGAAGAGAAGATISGGLLGAIGLGGLSMSSIGSAIGAGFMNTIAGGTLAGGQAAGLLAGGASTGTGIAGLAGAALPWVGGAAVIANALGLFRSTRQVGAGITGELGGTVEDFVVNRKSGSLFRGPSYSTPTTGTSALDADLQATFGALRQNAADMAQALGLSRDAALQFRTLIGSEKLSDDTGGQGVRLEGLSAEQVAAKLQTELTKANERLASAVLGTAGAAFQRTGETAAQTLERLAGSLTGVNGVLSVLGQSLLAVSTTGGDAASKLLEQFGGLQQFQAAGAQYLQDYYSEAERTAMATQQLTQQLGSVGLALPASREAYRQLVEAQDLNTESGRQAYAALLQLSPAFAAIVPATESLADASTGTAAAVQRAAEQMAEAGRRALAGLADQQAELQVELLRAQGQAAAAAELERSNALAKITEGLSAADAAAATAAYDFNAALRQQIDALNAAKTAAEQAAQAEAQRVAAIANERAGLEQRLLQQQGDTAGLRALELQSLDASNRAILERIYLLQDQQAAEQEAARVAQEAARAEEQRLAAIAQQRGGLEDRLLQLQGDAAAIRARELAALDPANRALLERIFALQDEQAAAATAAQAARDLEAAQQAAAQAEAQRVQAIANERDGLITRLLQAEGNTAELRARELAGLDASNRAILERIFAIEDEKIAQQAAAQAAEEAARAAQQAADEQARAAEQLRNAWQSVTDTIFDEVNRIRGLISGSSEQSLAGAQSRFALTAIQAKAGDQEAARLLPSLSQAMLTIAEAQATSLLELQRIRANAADTLTGVGKTLASQYGLTLPKLDTGTNYVPQDMAVMVHEGEAIVPRAYNPGANGASYVELVKVVRDQSRKNEEQSRELIRLNARMAEILNRWELNGLPPEDEARTA